MIKTYAHYSVPSLLLLALAAGCGGEGNFDEQIDGKEIIPSDEVFEFAPDGEEATTEKVQQEDDLVAKGAASRTYGSTFVTPITIGVNQNVSFSTSGGSVGADPVLVLFRRHDNSTTFSAFPYTQRVGIQTLAINDDTVGLHSSISYTNTSGQVENAFLMAFAYGNSTGQVVLSGGYGLVNIAAGSIRISGTAGQAWTSGSNGDPWLFTFDISPGLGNGVWNDDSSSSPVNRESLITGATSLTMWYVAHGFNSGTTTINF